MPFEKQPSQESGPKKIWVQFLNPNGEASSEGKGEADVVNVEIGGSGEPVAILKFPEGHSRSGQTFEATWNQQENIWQALPMD